MEKKVLIACSNYYPHSFGGTEVYVEAYARYLKQKGISVAIITSSPEEAFQQNKLAYEDDRLSVCNYTFNEIEVYGAKYKHISTEAIYSKQTANYSDSWTSFIDNNPAIQNTDILHIHSYTATIGFDLFDSIRSFTPNVKTITSYHTPLSCPKGTLMYQGKLKECDIQANISECATCVLKTQNKFPYLLTKGVNAMHLTHKRLPAIFRTSHLVKLEIQAFEYLKKITDEWWCYSEGIKNILNTNGIDDTQIKMVRHGIHEIFSAQENKKPTAQIVYLFSGRLAKIKGIKTLLEAWLKLPLQEDKQLWLTAKPFSDDQSINQLIQQASSRNDILFLGEQTSVELSKLYQKAHFVIIPSECFEIGPLVFHEAIAAKCHVISSNVGGCSELAKVYNENSTIFKAGDTNALKTIVEKKTYRFTSSTFSPHSFTDHFNHFIKLSFQF